MLVTLADNMLLVADSTAITIITGDPIPVGPDIGSVQVTIQTHRAFAMGTSPTFQVIVALEGSSDAQNWFGVTGLDATFTAEGDEEFSGGFGFAFARLYVELSTTAGDWSMWQGDVHLSGKNA